MQEKRKNISRGVEHRVEKTQSSYAGERLELEKKEKEFARRKKEAFMDTQLDMWSVLERLAKKFEKQDFACP